MLDEAPDVAGAASLFDQALTNGLAVIVGSEWPGAEREGGRTKSASALLKIIQEKVSETRPGMHTVRVPGHKPMEIDVATLHRGLNVTQPTRHARGGGSPVTRQHVEALVALDDHEALQILFGQYLDKTWRRAHVADRESRAHADRYLAVIGEAGADCCAAHIADYLPFDPKDRAVTEDPQDCPVCGRPTLLVEALDEFGEGVGSGTCVVCSYERSSTIAYWEAVSIRLARLDTGEHP